MNADDLPSDVVIGDVIPAPDSMFGADAWRSMTVAQLRREHRPIQIEGNAWVQYLCNSQAAANKLHKEGKYLTVTADEIERLVGLTWEQARELLRAKRAMKGGEVMRVWRE